jgi:Flp pilus assembly protein TadD
VDGETNDLRLAAYGESIIANRQLGLSRLFVLQEGGWKYIHSSDPELYYLPDDGDEERNLADAEPERVDRMRRTLEALLADRPEDAADEDRGVELTADEKRRLEALGYASRSAGDDADDEDDDIAAIGGDSPSEHAEIVLAYQDARRMITENRLDEAEAHLRRVVLALPDAPFPRHELSSILEKRGRADEMFAVCEEALAAKPDALDMRLWHARRLFRAGRRDEAVDHLETAVARAPESGRARAGLAGALQVLGRRAEARKRYEEAIALGERTVVTLRGLAVIHEREGDRDEAIELLEEALAIKPDSPTILRDLERVRGR